MHASWLMLFAAVALLPQASVQQFCPTARSISSSPFGFLKSAAQGVNDSYVYVAIVLDASSPTSAGDALRCSSLAGAGNSSDRLAAMQHVEAAIWSMQTFHTRYPNLLPGVTVGAVVIDSCESRLLTVQQLGNLQSCEVTFGESGSIVEPRNTIGYIGLDSSTVASAGLPLLQSTGKAVLSYQINDPQFASRSAWPLLARLTPDSLTDAEALAQAMRAVGAQRVQIVRGASQRHSAMAEMLASRLTQLGICVAANVQFSAAGSVQEVNAMQSVRPVFLLLDSSELRSFVNQMLSLRPSSGAFAWLLPSELYNSVNDLLPAQNSFFAGSILIGQFANARGFSDFQTVFKSLRPDSAGRSRLNPWFNNFWSQRFKCNLPGTSGGSFAQTCNYADSMQNLQSVSSFPASAARVIQATDLLLHSLEITRRAVCDSASNGLCSAFRSDSTRFRAVYDNLFNARSSLGYTDTELSAATSGPATFSLQLVNLQQSSGSRYSWTPVGAFTTNSLLLSSMPQTYGNGGSNASWDSVCSETACQAACPLSTPAPTTTIPTSTTQMPTSTFNSSGMNQLRFRSQYWVYALIVCASVGVLATLLFMAYILIIVLDLPSQLKTFNTLWSGQFLLLVILLGYATLFAWVPWPTQELCSIIRFMVGFEYAAIFSILLVKLLNLMNEYLKPVYQVLLFFFSLAVQVATNIEWMILVPSEVTMMPNHQRCNHTFISHLQTMIYCMLLIVLCVILAIRAHRIGKNNREVIFIGCAAGLSIPVWLAWTLVGSLNNSLDFEDASMAFGLFVNLTLILLILFIPKVYQLKRILQDEEEETSVPDLSDFDDEEERDSIYVISKPAPSIFSDPGEPSLVYGAQPKFASVVHPSVARSVSGDYLGRASLRVVPVGGPKKAYSDYNFPAQDSQRKLSQAGSDKNKTKAEKLSQLGFL